MKATIFHHEFTIPGQLYKLSSLPPPLCQHSHTHLTLHQDMALTTVLQQPATSCPHRSSLHLQLKLLVPYPLLSSPHSPNSLQPHPALSHPHLFLPHQYLHSQLPLSLQHLTLHRLWPHLSYQCRHQLQQVAPAVGVLHTPNMTTVLSLGPNG